jgi:hypothetical protein
MGVDRLDWSQDGYIKLMSGSTVQCTIGKLNSAPGGHAEVQADGNFVFYKNDNQTAAWSSGTGGLSQGTANYCAS